MVDKKWNDIIGHWLIENGRNFQQNVGDSVSNFISDLVTGTATAGGAAATTKKGRGVIKKILPKGKALVGGKAALIAAPLIALAAQGGNMAQWMGDAMSSTPKNYIDEKIVNDKLLNKFEEKMKPFETEVLKQAKRLDMGHVIKTPEDLRALSTAFLSSKGDFKAFNKKLAENLPDAYKLIIDKDIETEYDFSRHKKEDITNRWDIFANNLSKNLRNADNERINNNLQKIIDSKYAYGMFGGNGKKIDYEDTNSLWQHAKDFIPDFLGGGYFDGSSEKRTRRTVEGLRKNLGSMQWDKMNNREKAIAIAFLANIPDDRLDKILNSDENAHAFLDQGIFSGNRVNLHEAFSLFPSIYRNINSDPRGQMMDKILYDAAIIEKGFENYPNYISKNTINYGTKSKPNKVTNNLQTPESIFLHNLFNEYEELAKRGLLQ